MTNHEERHELKGLLKRYRKAWKVWNMAEMAIAIGTEFVPDMSGSHFFMCKIRACERELRLYDGGV